MPRATKGIESKTASKEQIDKACEELARYGEVSREISSIGIKLNDEIETLQFKALSQISALQEEREQLEASLETFAVANRSMLAEGKTISLPTGKLSWKHGKASLEGTDDKKAIASIRKLKRAKDFIKTSFSLKKAELLKEPDFAKKVDGVVFNPPKERFYIDPVEVKADTPATGKSG
ncbi:MAG TPA: host-nuclease inhibitor Gam family protein [Candidatus Dormibacteraeota bacterium]|nr:host-nuclease inhibitor Gam family protein [Candidatus Dormibacteraeota bacterium]